MSSEPDPWTKTFYHRAIQTKIGQALRAQHDLSQPLPDKLLTLLTELDKRIIEGDCEIAFDALAASIVHEINQPLGAMVANGNAGLRWLSRATPDLDEVGAALKRIVDDGHRANEMITSIRSMFKKDISGRMLLDINDLLREVLKFAELDLQIQGISVATELQEGLPQLLAARGQLRQVFINLIMNAIEATTPITDRARVLQIRSKIIQESKSVLVTIEDSGAGIVSKDKDRIFEPFFTTKSTGMGMGLAICRSIIGAHGGTLEASANNPYGTIFQVALRPDEPMRGRPA